MRALGLCAGHLPQNEAPVQSVLALARTSQKILERNFHALGLSETLSRPAGDYQIFEDEVSAQKAQSEYDSLGIKTKLMSHAVKTLGHTALHFPDDRSGNAYEYGCALAKDLERQNAVFIYDGKSRSAMTVFEDTLRLSGTLGEISAHPLLKRWFDLAPGIMGALSPAKEVWSGLRPISPMGRPYISGTSFPNLWINTGHAHMGWTLCAGAGALMADMILHDKKDPRFSYSG